MNFKATLNLARLNTYLKHDLTLNIRQYLAFILGLAVILFFINLFAISQTFATSNRPDVQLMDFYRETRTVTFILTYLIAIIFVVGSSFPSLRKKSGIMNHLIIPASTFEKFLVQFFLRVVLFTGIYFILFGIEFNFVITIYNSLGWNANITVPNFDIIDLHPNINSTERQILVLSIFSFVTFLFACATYFQKNAIVKTIISFSAICASTYILSMILSALLTPNDIVNFQPVVFERKLFQNFYSVELWFAFIGVFSSMFFLPLAYFNLKEKEV